MKLIAIAAFSWAHAGIVVERFELGQKIETEDQDLIDVATREGWVQPEGAEVIEPDPAPPPVPTPEPEKAPDPAPVPDPAPAPAAGRKKK